jgi:hypothetical protein
MLVALGAEAEKSRLHLDSFPFQRSASVGTTPERRTLMHPIVVFCRAVSASLRIAGASY